MASQGSCDYTEGGDKRGWKKRTLHLAETAIMLDYAPMVQAGGACSNGGDPGERQYFPAPARQAV